MRYIISTTNPPCRTFVSWLCFLGACLAISLSLAAQEVGKFYIREYRVLGGKRLSNLEIGEAVYPYLGPGRTPEDVEQARQALEKVYQDKGYQTVSVTIPQQDPSRGVIRLAVTEGRVGRLRVNGAKWFLPSRIRSEVPSLAEGSVPNFKQVEKEIMAANRFGDRTVKPEQPRPGVETDTLDFDLTVEDKFPLHGSLELNNRNSADTTSLRLNGALSYANLFQLGHTLGLSAQIAPENTDDGLVYSGYYLARTSDKTSLMINATRQDSDISTLGGSAVVGRGNTVGARLMVDLPGTRTFYQNFDFGIDYKHFSEDLLIGRTTVPAPIEYWPLTASYGATWLRDKSFTEFNTALTLHLRGLGSDETDYANKRYNADGSFIYLRSDLAQTHDLKNDMQFFGKVQGQIAGQPLINNEQIAGGGLGTVRGYLESTALGDNGVFATAEVRSPTLIGKGDTSPNPKNELRFHAFTDAGLVGIYDPLPGQKKRTGLSSVGIGSRLRYREHFNASADVAVPLIEQTSNEDGEVRITFRGWADF